MENTILQAYRSSTKRLLLLDYDGTLTELMQLPEQAKPTPELLDLLAKLGKTPGNTLVIISGRKHEELDAWLGALPVWMMAEHGLMFKQPGQDWQPTQPIDTSWKPAIRQIMEKYSLHFDGSFIEEKTNGLVWHYKVAPKATDNDAKQLATELEPLAEQAGLKVSTGSYIIEVQAKGIHKGAAAKYWLHKDNWDFILAGGDDTTDEDLFAAMPSSAFCIHVGDRPTAVKNNLDTPKDMRQLLATLIGDN